ncbi:MAG TPA: thioredoxin family protein [Gammaproteobacteria bacterium]|nr:thioredoxin family protein [Gammaproteobacteria bacterium]
MAQTPSNMLPLGTRAPDFTLPDVVSGQPYTLQTGQPTVVVFMCNHCPFVQHILPKLVEVAADYKEKGVNFIAINSNDTDNYPEDAPEKMKALANLKKFSFPYLFDELQETAYLYQAACTPDFYLFDKELKCVYRGRFDTSTPSNGEPLTGHDLSMAMDHVLANKPVSKNQYPSIGCNIKWKE